MYQWIARVDLRGMGISNRCFASFTPCKVFFALLQIGLQVGFNFQRMILQKSSTSCEISALRENAFFLYVFSISAIFFLCIVVRIARSKVSVRPSGCSDYSMLSRGKMKAIKGRAMYIFVFPD